MVRLYKQPGNFIRMRILFIDNRTFFGSSAIIRGNINVLAKEPEHVSL